MTCVPNEHGIVWKIFFKLPFGGEGVEKPLEAPATWEGRRIAVFTEILFGFFQQTPQI